jgi:parallel beta-helix repeat protein
MSHSIPCLIRCSSRSAVRACAGSRWRLLVCWCVLAMGALVAPLSLQAQSTKIFVSSTGNDANDGSRGSPKRNFQAAHDAVTSGGEIVALDTAGYGAVSITKSVGITAPAGITGFVTTSGTANGITISSGATPVSLRGLTINAVNKSGNPTGILILGGGRFSVSDCTVSGYSSGLVSQVSSAATVTVSRSVFRTQSFSGLVIGSFANANVNLIVEDCELASNGTGLSVVASLTSGVSHRIELRDTLVAGNTTAGVSISGPNNTATLQSCTISANNEGIRAASSAAIKVDDCTLTGNTTGLVTATSGSLFSRATNTVEGNGTDGAFTNTTTYVAK